MPLVTFIKTVPPKHPFGDGNGFKFVGLSVNADTYTEVQITRGKTWTLNFFELEKDLFDTQ